MNFDPKPIFWSILTAKVVFFHSFEYDQVREGSPSKAVVGVPERCDRIIGKTRPIHSRLPGVREVHQSCLAILTALYRDAAFYRDTALFWDPSCTHKRF